jgi:hypothetical protein
MKVRQPSGILRHAVLMMEAVRASEMSVYFNETTRRYIPEGCHLQNPIPWLLLYGFVSPFLLRNFEMKKRKPFCALYGFGFDSRPVCRYLDKDCYFPQSLHEAVVAGYCFVISNHPTM